MALRKLVDHEQDDVHDQELIYMIQIDLFSKSI